MNLGLYIDMLVLMVSIFGILYTFQTMNQFIIDFRKLMCLSFFCSLASIVLFHFFSNNIVIYGIACFVLFSIVLFVINFCKISRIMYFCSFVITLNFLVFIMVCLWSRFYFNKINIISFSDFVFSIFCTNIILIISICCFKLKFILPNGIISFIILAITLSIMLLELFYIQQIKLFGNNLSNIVIYIVIGLIFFSNNVIIQYLYNNFHQLTIMSQNNFLTKITDSYVQGIHNEQEKVFKIRHDIKNNLIILQHLINNNQIAEANQVIDEINNHLKYKKSDVYTGNIFIDAYLTNVIVNSQIDVQIKCNDLNDLHYKPDIIAIIINLVDNAVENANHLVNIQIKRKNPNSILIKVSNDCEYDPSKHLKKSKKQGDHGYGLRIVKDVVNQYQGTYLTSYQNGMFTTYVMLNLEENDEK